MYIHLLKHLLLFSGEYGSILPLDFNKTHIRRSQIEALALSTPPTVCKVFFVELSFVIVVEIFFE